MRMGPMIAALFVVLSSEALAEESAEFRPMDGNMITQTLTGQVLDYDGAWQDFRASGKTLYNAGHDSWGNWSVRGDQYCSQWPPNDLWACYDMQMRVTAHGVTELRFIDAFDSEIIGRLRRE